MIKAKKLKKGDKVAVVSLSSGMLGENFTSHYIKLGCDRLRSFGLEPVFMPNALKGIDYLNDHPEARADDLKSAFYDETIKGIICAIGGDDTFRLAPYILDDKDFVEYVGRNPKLFTGFSDTTVNHLMFYKMGVSTFYGPNYINDLSEMDDEMLSYTYDSFKGFYLGDKKVIESSDCWYEERTDFSSSQMGVPRVKHKELRGFELLQGSSEFEGELLGGCIESMYDLLAGKRYPEELEINRKYKLFPEESEWCGKVFFYETSEEQPDSDRLREMLLKLKEQGVFKNINGVIVGKPQNEVYYDEYKSVIKEVLDNEKIPVLCNVNFGHAYPRTVLAYGAKVKVNATIGTIEYMEDILE